MKDRLVSRESEITGLAMRTSTSIGLPEPQTQFLGHVDSKSILWKGDKGCVVSGQPSFRATAGSVDVLMVQIYMLSSSWRCIR
jgi:hypothetical protein